MASNCVAIDGGEVKWSVNERILREEVVAEQLLMINQSYLIMAG